MRSLDERFRAMEAIEREYRTARIAVEMLGERLRADPSALRPYLLKFKDYVQLQANLEATYLIRLFAEFEEGLRHLWRTAFRRTSHPRTRDLLAALTARCRIPPEWHQHADDVRQFRNSLVHGQSDTVAEFTFAEARHHLFRFLSRIPPNW